MRSISYTLILSFCCFHCILAQTIPLAEHPRPDFERPQWQNLNGVWQFEFDSLNIGLENTWYLATQKFSKKITVPFPWGSKLSGIEDLADIAWYQREVMIDPSWKDKRVFITIGASDWETSVWLDGKFMGKHQGGYVPFSFDLSEHVKFGEKQTISIRVDDQRRDFTLYGKQGYGNARGVWQTVYLEARGKTYLDALHFTPDIDQKKVTATAYLSTEVEEDTKFTIQFENDGEILENEMIIKKGKVKADLEIPIENPHLWTLNDPYLYEAEATLGDDLVKSYFAMRKISVVNLPGTPYPYIALNNQPIYLQLTLDQAYHPEGYYTFPSDQFMKEEIQRSKSIGLNGIRPHIKVEVPRKLYWADKLGLLVMADLPNSWGEPDASMQKEAEYTLRQMIKRDYNHPSIFSWVIFNESWGLFSTREKDGKKNRHYLPKTQNWVASMYYLAKSLDATRLVEDNSICCGGGHTETDINSFHDYLPGWAWEEHLRDITQNSFPGSTFQFEEGFTQGDQPKINSECGNVWGYEGSTGDVDWSWDYHSMINSFRKYPEIAGWLYTEHHDVINEWNGYWRYDRSEKFTGMGEIMPGMSLKDLHADIYLSTGNEICKTVRAGDQVQVPLFLSSMSAKEIGKQLRVTYQLLHTNELAEVNLVMKGSQTVDYKPFMQKSVDPIALKMPRYDGLAVLQIKLEGMQGEVIHRNFMHFEILGGDPLPKTKIISVKPQQFSAQNWSKKQWSVLEGLKVNGAGKGYFEYTFDLSSDAKLNQFKEAYFLMEVSAKQLFDKDKEGTKQKDVDFMLGGRVSPSSNPNAYPMTDEQKFPSKIDVLLNGEKAFSAELEDDPADHRGVLSWHHQLKDRKLREAGSYGYLIKVPVKRKILQKSSTKRELSCEISI